jgi:hypothetical protein
MGRAFGVRVIAWSQNLTEERAAAHRAVAVDAWLEAGAPAATG